MQNIHHTCMACRPPRPGCYGNACVAGNQPGWTCKLHNLSSGMASVHCACPKKKQNKTVAMGDVWLLCVVAMCGCYTEVRALPNACTGADQLSC